jgi:ribosome recycling factor
MATRAAAPLRKASRSLRSSQKPLIGCVRWYIPTISVLEGTNLPSSNSSRAPYAPILPQLCTIKTPSPTSWRSFSTTYPALKKSKGKAAPPPPPVDSFGRAVDDTDAFDFSGLQAKILKATEHFTHQLSQLRAGGRFNPEQLEDLKVQLNEKGDGGKVSTTKLKDLAQIIAKGRNVSVICHEEDVSRVIQPL